jgi:hypothetical protein
VRGAEWYSNPRWIGFPGRMAVLPDGGNERRVDRIGLVSVCHEHAGVGVARGEGRLHARAVEQCFRRTQSQQGLSMAVLQGYKIDSVPVPKQRIRGCVAVWK